MADQQVLTEVGTRDLSDHLAAALDAVAVGQVIRIVDKRRGKTRGYIVADLPKQYEEANRGRDR